MFQIARHPSCGVGHHSFEDGDPLGHCHLQVLPQQPSGLRTTIVLGSEKVLARRLVPVRSRRATAPYWESLPPARLRPPSARYGLLKAYSPDKLGFWPTVRTGAEYRDGSRLSLDARLKDIRSS